MQIAPEISRHPAAATVTFGLTLVCGRPILKKINMAAHARRNNLHIFLPWAGDTSQPSPASEIMPRTSTPIGVDPDACPGISIAFRPSTFSDTSFMRTAGSPVLPHVARKIGVLIGCDPRPARLPFMGRPRHSAREPVTGEGRCDNEDRIAKTAVASCQHGRFATAHSAGRFADVSSSTLLVPGIRQHVRRPSRGSSIRTEQPSLQVLSLAPDWHARPLRDGIAGNAFRLRPQVRKSHRL